MTEDRKILLPPIEMQERIRAMMAPRNAGRLQIKAATQGQPTELDLYGEIGFFGISAAAFRAGLKGAGTVTLRVNSPGGDVFDGIAMYNDLVDHPYHVNVVISGLAASAASIVAMAGDTIQIAESARFMIHNAWGVVMGNRNDMREMASVMDGIDKSMARIYADRTGTGIRSVAKMMDDETWINSREAVDLGFADSLTAKPKDVAARISWNLSAFQHVPEDLQVDGGTEDDTDKAFSIREFERLCHQAGASHRQAKELAARFKPEVHRDDEPNVELRDVDQPQDAEMRELIFNLNVRTLQKSLAQ